MKWPWTKSKASPEPVPEPVVKPSKPIRFPAPGLDVTLTDWRANEQLVADAREVLHGVTFQNMLAVLRGESPAYTVLGAVDLATRAAHQARTEGYNEALRKLMLMGELDKVPGEMPEPTFLPEEPTPEPEG